MDHDEKWTEIVINGACRWTSKIICARVGHCRATLAFNSGSTFATCQGKKAPRERESVSGPHGGRREAGLRLVGCPTRAGHLGLTHFRLQEGPAAWKSLSLSVSCPGSATRPTG